MNKYCFAVILVSCCFSTLSVAQDCLTQVDSQLPTYDEASSELRELGFITGGTDNRSFHPGTLKELDAFRLSRLYSGIDEQKDLSAEFWLKTAGSSLPDEEQARCFVRLIMLQDHNNVVVDLKNLSTMIQRMPEHEMFVLAMTNIVQELDSWAILEYLQAEQAVVYSSGVQGHANNAANAIHNRKVMQHLPRDLMGLMAERIDQHDTAGRATVYQVRNMGYE